MLTGKRVYVIIIALVLLSQNLFSQSIVTGTIRDTGNEPVAGAVVELIDQTDPTLVFSAVTNTQGEYSIQITATGIGNITTQQPGAFNLLQNYPNPFNPSTVISYELPRPSYIRIEIYNVLGQKIRTLFDGFQSNLFNRVVWDATNEQNQGVAAGVYIYCLSADGIRLSRKMLLLDGHLGLTGSTGTSAAGAAPGGPTGLGKATASLYRLRVSGVDCLSTELENVLLAANMKQDVTIIRVAGSMTDIDGNIYKTVRIGNQEWMVENLKVTHYSNGDPIPNVTNKTEWSNLTSGAYSFYNNDNSYAQTFGALYNWYAVADKRNLAPAGWHIPTDAEWQTLVDFLGGKDVAGGKLKETGTEHWTSPNSGATNTSGFAALPGGYRYGPGNFYNMGNYAYFWSITGSNKYYAKGRLLYFNNTMINRNNNYKLNGFSVRCVREYTEPPVKPSVPTLALPKDGTIDFNINPLLSWNNVENTDYYGIQVASDSDFTSLVLDETSIFATQYQLVNLIAGVTYYWHVNASNIAGSSDWSEAWSFSVLVDTSETITDIDGNKYKIIKIGDQVWMAENLRVTHYRNGDPIPNVTNNKEWSNLSTGAYCSYNNDISLSYTFGELYNWYAVVDKRNLAPEGWHIPTDAEWQTLVDFLGGNSVAGGLLKETGTLHWTSPNTGADNESGFTALPAGYRYGPGGFNNLGNYAYFWSVTGSNKYYAKGRLLSYNSTSTNRANYYKLNGFSIRCVKD